MTPPDIQPERVRAVVFDLGGVFLEGGPDSVRAFGARVGLAEDAWDALRRELFVAGDLWNRVERAQATLDEFAAELRLRLTAHGVRVSLDQARNFMGSPGDPQRMRLRPEIVRACDRLRALMPTALLTNNVREWREGWRARLPVAELFDLVVDSSEVGMRKPEPPIYRLIEQGLGLLGADLLFIDDLGVNLKAARALGWQTLKYDDTARVVDVLDAVARGRPPRAR